MGEEKFREEIISFLEPKSFIDQIVEIWQTLKSIWRNADV